MGIKRREFLKVGAATATVAGAAGAVGLAGSSCAKLFPDSLFEAQPPLPDMKSYLARVDQGLDYVASSRWSEGSSEKRGEEWLDEGNGFGRKVIRSLYLAGMFGDLPDEGQAHPEMQARVRRILPEMDEVLDGTVEYLSSVSDEQVERLQRFLRQHDDPGMVVAEQLDRHAVGSGLSTRRRLQTRAMITQVVSRLKNQPPRKLFDEYLGKVEQQAALAGTVAESERYLISQLGERAFWERQQRLALVSARWQEEGAGGGDVIEPLPADALPDAGASAEEADAGVVADTADAGPPAAVAGGPSEPAADPAVEAEREQLRAELAAVTSPELTGDPFVPTGAERATRRGEQRIHRGGWVLGIGAVTTAVGLVLACTEVWFVGAILGTAAAILLHIALVLIIAGAIDVRIGRETA